MPYSFTPADCLHSSHTPINSKPTVESGSTPIPSITGGDIQHHELHVDYALMLLVGRPAAYLDRLHLDTGDLPFPATRRRRTAARDRRALGPLFGYAIPVTAIGNLLTAERLFRLDTSCIVAPVTIKEGSLTLSALAICMAACLSGCLGDRKPAVRVRASGPVREQGGRVRHRASATASRARGRQP
jgi:hypothetical protein